MYAIIEHKGKQYKVSKGDILKLPRSSDVKKNDIMTFDNILILKNENNQVIIGSPKVSGVTVKAKVIEQIRDKKIIVFKKKRRHNYRRKIGHRQDLTLIKIEDLVTSSTPKNKTNLNEGKVVKTEISDGS
tara:strand:- start:161 stop:550 length:390 start_codon:yes stop_codon:yes gene_type:complete